MKFALRNKKAAGTKRKISVADLDEGDAVAVAAAPEAAVYSATNTTEIKPAVIDSDLAAAYDYEAGAAEDRLLKSQQLSEKLAAS